MPPRLPVPGSDQRSFRMPPLPRITAPSSGRRSRASCKARYCSSVSSFTTVRVKTGVSMKRMSRHPVLLLNSPCVRRKRSRWSACRIIRHWRTRSRDAGTLPGRRPPGPRMSNCRGWKAGTRPPNQLWQPCYRYFSFWRCDVHSHCRGPDAFGMGESS